MNTSAFWLHLHNGDAEQHAARADLETLSNLTWFGRGRDGQRSVGRRVVQPKSPNQRRDLVGHR